MWVWCCDPQHTIRTSSGEARKDKVATTNRIQAKLANLWTGPFKILAVGPCRCQEIQVGPKLLFFDLMQDKQTNPHVSVVLCKRCNSPGDPEDIPEFLPWKLRSHVLHHFALIAPPFYPTAEDVEIELDISRAQPTSLSAHRVSRDPWGSHGGTVRNDEESSP